MCHELGGFVILVCVCVCDWVRVCKVVLKMGTQLLLWDSKRVQPLTWCTACKSVANGITSSSSQLEFPSAENNLLSQP